jgi:steroid delta-isomerase-like uncharacterized protein
MTRDELIAQAKRSFEVWNAHDAEGLAEFYAEDATVRDAGDPDNPARGRDAIVTRARQILGGFSDAKIEPTTVCVDGNQVCIEWRFTGTHDGEFLGVPATGRRVENIGATMEEVDSDGKTVSETAYWDAAIFLRQVGAIPEPAHAATAS